MKNVLEFLESAAGSHPDKIAFADETSELSYSRLTELSMRIGSYVLGKIGSGRQPVAVIGDKTPLSIAGFFGVVYSGNFYVVIDSQMPTDRVNAIFSALKPRGLLLGKDFLDRAEELDFDGVVMNLDTAAESLIDNSALEAVRASMIDVDPLYALFTSGSTGVPKGAVVSHRSVIAYATWTTETFAIDENTVFGNQTPFYFSMSVLDIFSTIKAAATLYIIPKMYFSFPIKLAEFLNERRINTIYWVPSAMCIVANCDLFKYVQLPHLKKILFAGEVMPMKQLNYWRRAIPHAFYANLYGPTEVTDICTYYVVDRDFEDHESLPIGRACNNCGVLVVTDEGKEAAPGQEGELLVRGSFLAMGYYGNEEKTKAAFVQNPLNSAYPETVYRTGDIVKLNERGELLYITRKDFQIKHMGYRIELGELEAAVSSLEKVEASACVFDENADSIVCVYKGRKVTEQDIIDHIGKKLPPYMMPNVYVKIKEMPYNRNGKIDRVFLKKNYKNI